MVLSTLVTNAVAPLSWFITLSPTVTVLVKVAELSTNLSAVVDVVVPSVASPPPCGKVGALVVAFQVPINLKPPARVFTWDWTFPKAVSIESDANTDEAVGAVNPVNTFPVTEALSKVTAPLTSVLPLKLAMVVVASPVKDIFLAVSKIVAVAEFTFIELGKLSVIVCPVPAVVIWLAVPTMFNASVFNITAPLPVSAVKSKSEPASKESTYSVVANLVELFPALWVVAVEALGKTTPAEFKAKEIPVPEATVTISFVVPVMAKVSLFNITAPVPESPVKSKSLALFKLFT